MTSPAMPESNPSPELTPEQIAAQQIADVITTKFTDQEECFVKIEDNIKKLREFFVVYRNAMAPFSWSCYGTSLSISFNCQYLNKDKQKEIARAFGPTGWIRKKNEYACGRIDWHKTVDGVLIEIDCAEQLNPKLIDEVKL